jgi:hypothetical protein
VFAHVGGVGPNGVARSDVGIPSQELAALMCAEGLRAESTVRLDRRFSCFSSRGLPARLPNATGSELNGCARTTHPGRFTESRASPASVGARFHEERHIFSRRKRFFVNAAKCSLTRSLAHPPPRAERLGVLRVRRHGVSRRARVRALAVHHVDRL